MDFFVLELIIGSSYETRYESTEPVRYGDAPRCPECGSYIGPRTWLPPLHAMIFTEGLRQGDVAFAVAGTDLLFSERMIRAWQNSSFSGLSSIDPVEIHRRDTRQVPHESGRFYRVSPIRSARVSFRERNIENSRSQPCPACGHSDILNAIKGVHVDPDTWDGEEIFAPHGVGGMVIVTRSFLSWARDHEFLNVTAIPAESYYWNPLNLRLSK